MGQDALLARDLLLDLKLQLVTLRDLIGKLYEAYFSTSRHYGEEVRRNRVLFIASCGLEEHVRQPNAVLGRAYGLSSSRVSQIRQKQLVAIFRGLSTIHTEKFLVAHVLFYLDLYHVITSDDLVRVPFSSLDYDPTQDTPEEHSHYLQGYIDHLRRRLSVHVLST